MPMTLARLLTLAAKAQAIHVGALAPQGIFFLSTPSDLCPDMSAVVSSQLWMQKYDASEVALSSSVYLQTTAALVLSHPFGASDIQWSGRFSVYAVHILADGGTVRSKETQRFTVLERFQ